MNQEQLEEFAKARLGANLRDKWTLDTLLGVGGTASVYSATHRNGKRVAVKVLHPELSAHEHFRERFLREAYVGNHIEHTGAVTVHDDDTTEDGCAFLVMDLLEGENLEIRRDRKGGTLDSLEVLSLTDDVLDTLQAAHAKGVIHRDIKPENLFLTRENRVRLLDFGIARINVPENPGQTLAGVSMGTPAFMPPEQASAHWDKVDAQSDLWALGASMFTLLTGRYVHQGSTVNESLVLAVTKPAPKIETIQPDLPPQIAEIVNRALEREKSDRYKSASEMQFDVRMAYRELQGDLPEGERYSLTDGNLALHSAPPGPVRDVQESQPDLMGTSPSVSVRAPSAPSLEAAEGTSLGSSSITGDPVEIGDVKAWEKPWANRKFIGAAAATFGALLAIVLLLAEEEPSTPAHTPGGPLSTAPKATTAENDGPGDWSDISESLKEKERLERERREAEAAKAAALAAEDAGAEDEPGQDEQAEKAAKPGAKKRAPRWTPRPRPAARPANPPPQTEVHLEEEFDPFAKRH